MLEIHSGVRQGCAYSPARFNYITAWSLGQDLQDYPGIQNGANVHVSDLFYADDTIPLCNSCREIQGLNQLTTMPQQSVGALSLRRPRLLHHSLLVSSAKPSCLMMSHWRKVTSSSMIVYIQPIRVSGWIRVVLLVYRRSSPNAGLATLRVHSSGNSFCPHHLARSESELEAN